MSLDVRLPVRATGTTPKQEGKNALLRMGLLGNPKDLGNRVLLLGRRHRLLPAGAAAGCVGRSAMFVSGYADVEAVYKAIEMNGNRRPSPTIFGKAVGTVSGRQSLTALPGRRRRVQCEA